VVAPAVTGNPVPVIVTFVPAGPAVGVMPVTVGNTVTCWAASAPLPPLRLTV
jgi:hypothetical protein